ncbi:MAG: hypothetical protein HQL91_08010 [Magnetococcales bacterium]|nr:hypothetical protein [Magnetococcales bacterium]
MSIAIIAPQKFDFQDIACVALILRHAKNPTARFFVEPKEGEDGELYFDRNGIPFLAEVQVKGAAGIVKLADVATCLAHTPPRIETNTLLERLISDPNRLAILVMSGRCDDASSHYVLRMDLASFSHDQGHVSIAQARAFLDAFSVAWIPGDPSSLLNKKRQSHNSYLAKRLELMSGIIRATLSRLVIFEQLDEPVLEAYCAERLRSDYHIPGDRLGDVIRRCRAAIKTAKTQAIDAFPLIRSELERAMPQSIRPPDYVGRGIEEDLSHALSNEGVLLLSGRHRIGKTWAARQIASTFQSQGYEVKEIQDVDQAERFLVESSDAARLVLLDDPLGGIYLTPEATRTLSRLRALITRLSPHRKLIVAQETDRLLFVARATTLAGVTTGPHRWRNLDTLQPPFLAQLWHRQAECYDVPRNLRDNVHDALRNGVLTLEPGCLLHLAVNHAQVPSSGDLEQIERFARQDASDLGRTLAGEPSEPLIAALAIVTTSDEPIDQSTLAFVIGSGGNSLPGRSSRLGRIITIGKPLQQKEEHPKYDSPPVLTNDQNDWLDSFEQRRLLKVDNRGLFTFAHPYYRAAAESISNPLTRRKASRTITTVQRGLFCLLPQTSHATARNLSWVFNHLQSYPDVCNTLLDAAEDGLRSFFPATRDLCFLFLFHHLDAMSTERRRNLPTWVACVTSVKLDDLEWTNGQAHLPFNDFLDADSLFDQYFSNQIDRDDVASELDLLNDSSGPFVSAERAARVLKYFVSFPNELTEIALGRLLSYDEAAIRAESIRLWLTKPRNNDDNVLVRLFSDDHPSCALAMLKGAITGWKDYDSPRQTTVLQGLVTLAGNPACAAAMLERLIMFNRVEETGETPPWPIFEAVTPAVMAALPHNTNFIEARLFAVARSAVKVLPPTSIISLCDGWIDWLAHNAEEDCLREEFALGVAEILITATKDEPMLRFGRVDRLLAFPATDALVVFVADLVDGWDHLTKEEQTAVLNRLRSGRSDDIWLKAVALTRSSPPEVIETTLLSDSVRLNDSPDKLLNHMSPELLTAAVHVYTGQPQPLWWLGTHHSGKSVWEPVIELIARTPIHPLLDLAWDHIANDGDGSRVADAIRDIGSTGTDHILDILIRLKVGCNGNFMPEAWAALLALSPDDTCHSAWIDRMAAPVGAILDDLSDLQLWLSEKRDINSMIKRLESDLLPIKIMTIFLSLSENVDKGDTMATIIQALEIMINQQPPQLFGTCDRLLNVLKDQGVEAATLQQTLEVCRSTILEKREQTQAKLKRTDFPLKGWIKP